MSVQLNDLVNYIWNHKAREKVYPNWTKKQIEVEIISCLNSVCCSWSEDERGMVNGIVLARPFPEYKTLYLSGIFADDPFVLLGFMQKLEKMYPGWTLCGNRNNRLKHYGKNYLSRLWRRQLNLVKRSTSV